MITVLSAAIKSVILIISIYHLIIQISIVKAQTMSSQNYNLKGGINSSGGESKSQNTKLNTTVGQTAQGTVKNANYTIRKGFQYLPSSEYFVFSVSQPIIDFGILSPTNPVVRISTLRVLNPSARGYSVIVSEDHPLQASDSATFIPDTTCDSGLCSETKASAWTSTLSYGFGYRCTNIKGKDCVLDFSDPAYYKQFPNTDSGEQSQSAMQSATAGPQKEAQIVYKLNVAGTQAAGSYTNTIRIIASPNF